MRRTWAAIAIVSCLFWPASAQIDSSQNGVSGCGPEATGGAFSGPEVPGGCSPQGSNQPGNAAQLLLSNTTVASSATVGTTVGTLSVINGSGSYTFSLTSNPGSLFSIAGALLKTAASLTVGSDPITVQANNGAGGIATQPFVITVTGSCSNKLDFSQACNSQYVPLIF